MERQELSGLIKVIGLLSLPESSYLRVELSHCFLPDMICFYFSDLRSTYLKKTLPTDVFLIGDMETVGREGQKEFCFFF